MHSSTRRATKPRLACRAAAGPKRIAAAQTSAAAGMDAMRCDEGSYSWCGRAHYSAQPVVPWPLAVGRASGLNSAHATSFAGSLVAAGVRPHRPGKVTEGGMEGGREGWRGADGWMGG